MNKPVHNPSGLYALYDWISIKTPPTENGRYFVAIKEGNDWHITIRRYSLGTFANPHPHWAKNTCGVRYWMPMFLLPPYAVSSDIPNKKIRNIVFYTRRTL